MSLLQQILLEGCSRKEFDVLKTLTLHISPLNEESFTLFKELTEEIKNKVKNLKKRTSSKDIKNLIKECDFRPH